MFRPSKGHHQAFFETFCQYAAYMVGIPTIFTKIGGTIYPQTL